MNNVINYNDKGQLHGFQKWYWNSNDKIWFRGNFKHNRGLGYLEWHSKKETRYYIK